MWSLPDIKHMNSDKALNKRQYLQMVDNPKAYTCDACDSKATHAELYFDIFSDDPSGVSFSCDEHVNTMDEGFFLCESCGRRMIENITWERYERNGECLKCAAENYFHDESNWINPKEIHEILRVPNLPLWRDGVLNLFGAPHVLGVEQPVPHGFENIPEGYATFDSMDGHQIDYHDFEAQIRSLTEPFLLIMDGAFQFAVRLALYRKVAGITR